MLQKPPKSQGPFTMSIRPGNNMFSKRIYLLYHFSMTIHLASFYVQKYFQKKNLGKMLIEQTSEFQSKGPGPFGRTCTLITGKIHD